MDKNWNLSSLPTPALVIHAEIVRDNINRMAEYARAHGFALRPHIKTHKMKRIAAMQMETGAVGLTCAKVGEAEIMQSVTDDIFIAYSPVDSCRSDNIAELAIQKKLGVGIDSELAAQQLSKAASKYQSEIGVLVDLDTGFRRTGVQLPEHALKLASIVSQLEGLKFRGLMYFPGNLGGPSEKQTAEIQEIEKILATTVSLLKSNGLECEIVSGGSTPAAYQTHLSPTTNEMRPGTYVFNDRNSIDFGVAEIENCAARIVTTVVSDAVGGQIVVDAGSKTLTSDRNIVSPDSGYGYVVEYPNAIIRKLSEEHGQIDISICEKKPELGDRLTIIPNHICPCVNLQNQVWWLEDDQLEELTVDARGLLI